MAFLNNFFKKEKEISRPDIRFGRYSDIYKNTERYEAWDKALSLYEENKYFGIFF